MKKAISIILVLMILLSLACVPATAAEETDRTGIQFEWTTINEVEHPTGYYFAEKHLEQMPVTFEAWVYIPQSVYAEPAGVILSSYWNSSDHSFRFEVGANGIPALTFGHREGELYGRSYAFNESVIAPDSWTHVAVVYGTGTDNKQVFCYINGELKESTPSNYWYEPDPSTIENFLCLGGDFRCLNRAAFRGQLGDVTVYTDVRTAEEVLKDVTDKPDLQDPSLMFCYELFDAPAGTDIPDASNHGYDMSYGRMWLTEEEMQEVYADDDKEYAYTIAFIPDIQESTRNFPDKLDPLFDFLVDNVESKNIKYVIGLGDMTDKNIETEWEIVKKQMDKLNDKVPYSLIRGNHDILYNPEDNTTLHDDYFSQPTDYYYNHVKENGGFFNEKSTINTYLLFSVGDIDYIIVNLDFGASDKVLEWADTILEEHKDHRAIIVTHGYLNGDGDPLEKGDVVAPSLYSPFYNDGVDIWEKMVRKHENIDMVVSGHVGLDSILCTPATGDNGNTVYQLLMDTQGTDLTLGGLGIVGLMHFTEDGRFAKVEYYSTVLERYFRETNANIRLDFGEAPAKINWVVITACGAAGALLVAAVVVIAVKRKKSQGEK